MVRAVRITQQHAEAARKELRRLDALSHEYLPSAVHDAILLPLKPSAQLDNTWEVCHQPESLLDFVTQSKRCGVHASQVVEAELQCRPQKRSQKLRDHLEHALSEGLFAVGLLTRRFGSLHTAARPLLKFAY